VNFEENIQKLSFQIAERKNHITNEEMTKHALIIPFLQVLGFDVFNPLEIKSEYNADFGKKKGEKVDYAIFKDDKPIIFIEAKSVNENINGHDAQLSRYFNTAPEVKLAILTNGIQYKFFTDLNFDNIMDENPFIQLDITNLSDSDIEVLSKFKKESFEKDELLKYAEELVYTSNLNDKLNELFKNPSDDFIRYLIKDFSDTRVTVNVVDRFRPIVKKAISNAILDIVSQGLYQQNTNLENTKVDDESNELVVENTKKIKIKQEIVTTKEELSSFNFIRAILSAEGKDISTLNYKDTINYFNITNNTNWFLRFNFENEKKKYVITKIPYETVKSLIYNYDAEKISKCKEGSKIYIDSIDDLKGLEGFKYIVTKCYEDSY